MRTTFDKNIVISGTAVKRPFCFFCCKMSILREDMGIKTCYCLKIGIHVWIFRSNVGSDYFMYRFFGLSWVPIITCVDFSVYRGFRLVWPPVNNLALFLSMGMSISGSFK